MGWKKTPDVAQYKGADWNNFISIEHDCSPEQAKRIAMCNPQITFFFICREYMVLEGPVYDKYGAFNPGDAVFFSGEPWYGSAPQCDGYQKDGIMVAYVSPPATFTTPYSLSFVADYTLADGSPAIDIVCICYGNFCTLDALPYIRANNNNPPTTQPFNPNVQTALSDGSIAYLQSKGITVVLTVGNGWTPTGWSEFTEEADAQKFAAYLQSDVVDQYGLDGIDIDDEYSTGVANDYSLIMVTSAMQSLMPGKIISKALFQDIGYFPPNSWNGITLLDTLTYGSEMSYWAPPQEILPDYAGAGMNTKQLCGGFWASQSSFPIDTAVQWLKDNNYGGAMMFEFNAQANIDLMGQIVNDWYGPGNWNKTS
jgi:hypothetical protein